MFALLKKKNVVTNAAMDSSDEISLLKMVAQKAASKLELDGQEIKSGLFASAAAGTNQLIDRRVLMTHASTEAVTTPKFVIITLADAIYWNGDANQPVDYVVVTIMPSNDSDTQYTEIAARIETVVAKNADQLSEWHDSASKLNQMMQEFN